MQFTDFLHSVRQLYIYIYIYIKYTHKHIHVFPFCGASDCIQVMASPFTKLPDVTQTL